jgi:hypothetical protein
VAYNLLYANQGSIRNQPVKDWLAKVYEQAAQKAGIDSIRVVSGGQDATGSHRTGSHRHDLGGAGDIQLLVGGRPLDFTNKDDLPRITSFLQTARGLGAGGIGAGSDYMGNTTFHVGGGGTSTWGAGGRSKNAPGWLLQALGGTPTGASEGAQGVTLNTPQAGISAPPATAAPTMESAIQQMASGFGGQPAEASGPIQSMGATAPPEGGGGEDISAGAAALMSTLMQNRRKRYGLSLMGSPFGGP